MKKYLQHMQTKSPHERRQHATQIAGVCTALVFVVWVTTLGVRMSSTSTVVQNQDGSLQQTQLANAGSAQTRGNTLEVATSSAGVTLPYAY